MGDIAQYNSLGLNNVGKLFINPNIAQVYEEEEQLERDLQSLIKKYRDSKKFFTRFNEDLSCVLGSALQSYETNRLTGASISSETFQSGIKNIIPEGHIFKAFPIEQRHKNAVKIFEQMKVNPVCEEILNIIGDQIHYAVRAKIVTYPENVFAVWVCVGVHYIEI